MARTLPTFNVEKHKILTFTFCTEIFFAKLEVLSYVSCLYENNYVNVDAAVDVLS